VRSLQRALGLTVFLVTHDVDTLYATCDRIVVLGEKKVLAVGTIPELRKVDHPWIQEYFSGPRGRAAAPMTEEEA
jgi:phospholipid/cholesterol/gamma-HCH transport system ATP-binding protein